MKCMFLFPNMSNFLVRILGIKSNSYFILSVKKTKVVERKNFLNVLVHKFKSPGSNRINLKSDPYLF